MQLPSTARPPVPACGPSPSAFPRSVPSRLLSAGALQPDADLQRELPKHPIGGPLQPRMRAYLRCEGYGQRKGTVTASEPNTRIARMRARALAVMLPQTQPSNPRSGYCVSRKTMQPIDSFEGIDTVFGIKSHCSMKRSIRESRNGMLQNEKKVFDRKYKCCAGRSKGKSKGKTPTVGRAWKRQ